jgi:Metal-dependent hydrolase
MHQGSGFCWGRVAFQFLFAATVFLLVQTAPAALLLHESFDYANGPLAAESTAWSTHSGNSGELLIQSGRLLVQSSNTEDANALLSGQPYNSANPTNRLYASFVLRCLALPSASGNYFAHFKSSSTTTFACRIWTLTSGAAAGTFRLGISSTSGNVPNAIYPQNLTLNTDYRIVVRLVTSNSVAKLWIDPDAESDFSVITMEAPAEFSAVAFAFRQATGSGTMLIDDLRVGTRFMDVVPDAIPELPPTISNAPGSQAAREFSAVTLSVEAAGIPTPTFQWRFNGTNIPNATNSSLILTQATFAHEGFYGVIASNDLDVAVTEPAVLNIWSPEPPTFSILNYNLHGNGILNWSTNTGQIRAIGRQIQFLDPDILTLQEIPVTNNGTAQMQDFVNAYRPGFFLATNSTDDLYIHSVIISRFPIVASRSWLNGEDLTPFGYSGTFKRDLFEAEIELPGFSQPLHVFTVHLKSGQDNDSAARRSAEAGAISNFFATAFLSSNRFRPYVLTGDMNEDIQRQPASNPRSVEKLISSATGLKLKTPFNSISRSELTFSIQNASGLSRRYDYILPCELLASNVVFSELFRSDLLDPLPLNLLSNDTRTASDHLPVLMKFANPYARSFQLVVSRTNDVVTISWKCLPGEKFQLEESADLKSWSAFTSEILVTTEPECRIQQTIDETPRFFRVQRVTY